MTCRTLKSHFSAMPRMPLNTVIHHHIKMGSEVVLSRDSLEHLSRFFTVCPDNSTSGLGGRAPVWQTELPETGPVVIKSYRRGGWAAKLTCDRYTALGPPRSQREYTFLARASALGIRVPQPVVYAVKGNFFYRAWLVTRQIDTDGSFAELAVNCPETAVSLLPSVSAQIKRLIRNRIHHVDLHPGNILIDRQGLAYLIDFDKARISRLGIRHLTASYRKRWRDAVLKYQLPQEINALELS